MDGTAVGRHERVEIAVAIDVGKRRAPPHLRLREGVARLARDAAELAADQPRYAARVESLLFDGASSAVLLREAASSTEIRVSLPQTGRFADLRVGEPVAFGFDPQRAVCFAAPV